MSNKYYSKTVCEHDVWRIKVGRRDYSCKDRSFFCLFGYVEQDETFHPVFDHFARSAKRAREIADQFSGSLCRFKNQRTLSKSLLRFLQNPANRQQIIDFLVLYWDNRNGEMVYHSVPVPIYRNDFPNRTKIIMSIDTHIQLSSQPNLIEIWKEWLSVYKKNLENRNKREARRK